MSDSKQTERVSSSQADQSLFSIHSEDHHVREQLRLAELMRDISLALIQSASLQEMIQQCAEALVTHFEAAFARIWTLSADAQILELQASAGMYTSLNGSHSRVQVGTLKIGLIASERLPHLTNAVIGDPRVSEQEWARQEGMIAFAGYPLLVSDRLIGVMALFARHTLSPSVLDAMASIANTIAIGIDRKQGEQERLHLLLTEQQAHRDAQLAHREAEQERRRSHEILESISDAFFALDQHWQFTYLNAQSEPLLQRSREDLLGKNVWHEFPEAVNSTFYHQYHKAKEQRITVSFEEWYPPLQTWFEVRAYPSSDGLSVYFHNINERKQIEQERERLLEIEHQAHVEAETALAVRTRFLSSISHDLKTPLASIKANSQLMLRRVLRNHPLDEAWLVERLRACERATTKMVGMIDDLLDLTRQQAGQHLDESFHILDLVHLLHQVVVEQRETTRRHRIQIQEEVVHLPIRANAARMDRVFTNLVGNAIKYSPAGGEITLSMAREEENGTAWAVVSITDRGLGIPSADLPYIFEPFHRAENIAYTIQGTGVGLASVTQVLEQHGGTISVVSQQGEGSTFTVRLPLVEDAISIKVDEQIRKD